MKSVIVSQGWSYASFVSFVNAFCSDCFKKIRRTRIDASWAELLATVWEVSRNTLLTTLAIPLIRQLCVNNNRILIAIWFYKYNSKEKVQHTNRRLKKKNTVRNKHGVFSGKIDLVLFKKQWRFWISFSSKSSSSSNVLLRQFFWWQFRSVAFSFDFSHLWLKQSQSPYFKEEICGPKHFWLVRQLWFILDCIFIGQPMGILLPFKRSREGIEKPSTHFWSVSTFKLSISPAYRTGMIMWYHAVSKCLRAKSLLPFGYSD